MIENYIFDLYGTLVDIRTDETEAAFWRRMALLYSLQGAAYGADELRDAYREAVEEQIDRLSAASTSLPRDMIEPNIRHVFRKLYTRKGLRPSAQSVKDTALFFRTLSLKHLGLYPKAKEVLATLRERGKGVYLLSNAQAAFTLPELDKLGLTELFDGIVLSSDAGVKKPSKAIFDRLLSMYPLSAQTCVMVGNDAEADMGGAASVGMPGRYIHTKQSPSPKAQLPVGCREIRSLRDLL